MAAVNPFATGGAPAANPFGVPASGAPTAAANPFGAPATAAASNPFATAPASSNPFGAAAPAASTTTQQAASAAAAAALTASTPPEVVPRVRPFGGFSWFQDLPRPLPVQPAATTYGQAPPPPAPVDRPPYDIERHYARIRVAYSNRPLTDVDIERPALAQAAAGGFGGFGAVPQQQAAGNGDGIRLKPEFIKTVWVLADHKQRTYAPPALKELDPAGAPVIVPTTNQPKLVELLRPDEVRPTRTRPDGSRILDETALLPTSERSLGMSEFESGPRFVQTVAIGFHGLKSYAMALERAATSLAEAARSRMDEVHRIRSDLAKAVTQVGRLDERQRRLSQRCVDAAQLVAEIYNPSDTASLTRDERQVIARVSAVQQRVTAPAGLHRRTASVQTQAALVTSHGPGSDSGGVSALEDPDALRCIVAALQAQQDSIDKLKEQVTKSTSHLQIIMNGLRERG